MASTAARMTKRRIAYFLNVFIQKQSMCENGVGQVNLRRLTAKRWPLPNPIVRMLSCFHKRCSTIRSLGRDT